MSLPASLSRLIDRLARLPGLGPKSATRLALHLLRDDEDQVRGLAASILEVKENIRFCSLCHDFTDQDPCSRCRDPRRDRGLICVVEAPGDLLALEASGLYQGLYHVLGGVLAPLGGIGPEDLRIRELLTRLDRAASGADDENFPPVREVLLATGASPEGESTAAYLGGLLKERGLKVTRLARGLPVGADLEYVDGATLKEALQYRREV